MEGMGMMGGPKPPMMRGPMMKTAPKGVAAKKRPKKKRPMNEMAARAARVAKFEEDYGDAEF